MSPIAAIGIPAERRILLPSNARGATTSAPFRNGGWRNIVLWVDVTINPGGGETLALYLNTELPDVGGTSVIVEGTVASSLGGLPGTFSLPVGPGVVRVWGTTVASAFEGVFPFLMDLQVIHSGAGLWTYSAGIDVT